MKMQSVLLSSLIVLTYCLPSVYCSLYFRDYLVLLYKGTYVAYGGRRSSERDLPECSPQGNEACNLSHRRYWQVPLVERLCRCPGHMPCPLHNYGGHTGGNGNNSRVEQHINSRAHLQFCQMSTGNIPMKQCLPNVVGLAITLSQRVDTDNGDNMMKIVTDSHTTLHCTCHEPKHWQLSSSSLKELGGKGNLALTNRSHFYTCQELPTCTTGDACSLIRPDTHESYYQCSCPPDHLCLVNTTTTDGFNGMEGSRKGIMPHFDGPVVTGICMLHSYY